MKFHFQSHPRLTYLNRINSAAQCSISLKFGTQVHYGSAEQASWRDGRPQVAMQHNNASLVTI